MLGQVGRELNDLRRHTGVFSLLGYAQTRTESYQSLKRG